MKDNRIKQDWLDSGFLVSTISLNDPALRAMYGMIETLTSAIGAEGSRPSLETLATENSYETMVFPQRDGEVTDWNELACRRYQTEKEALVGHKALVEAYS